MEHLFAYGTLMCEDIMEQVAGYRLAYESGTLKGFSRRSVKGEDYPALVLQETGYVDGVVYRNVPNTVWERLDRFEGEMYARQSVHIDLKDGSALLVVTYVVRPEFLNYVDQFEWDFDEFFRNGKTSFQKHYKGYNWL